MDVIVIQAGVREISERFARERGARQRRRELDPHDFEQLRDAGFLLTGVPTDQGGIWEDTRRSTRPICELLRTLAHGDSSVALVSAMHPAVLAFWLPTPEAPPPYDRAWEAQRRHVAETAREGAWWGTITSEPGSSGDVANTKAIAEPAGEDGRYLLTGQKHFGSGSGIASYMLTSAVPAGEREPDWFYLDLREVLDTHGQPRAGTTGVKLLAAWDGHGMTATQSHAFQYDGFPATRFGWRGNWRAISDANGGFIACAFTAVIVGIVEVAVETARQQVVRRRESLRAYERVEWSRVELEAWLIQQAYEAMLRAMDASGAAPYPALLGKTAIAELAESALGRISHVLGGGAYSRHAPFGAWAEDVRALGFLRPPWGLAYDRLFDLSLPASE